MQKHLLFVGVLLFILSNVLISQSGFYLPEPKLPSNSVSQEKVKGGFRTLKVYHYFYKFGEVDYNSQLLKINYKYDTRGNMIEKVSNETGFVEIDGKFTYKYDYNGYKIEEVGSDYHGKYITTFKYESNGNLIEDIKYYTDESIIKNTYKYNKNGKLIQNLYYDEGTIYGDGGKYLKITYKYDKIGQLIHEKYIHVGYQNEPREFGETSYEYDKIGQLIKYKRYHNDGEDPGSDIWNYKYDEKGYLIFEASEGYQFGAAGDGVYSHIITYKYDGKGNLIYKTSKGYSGEDNADEDNADEDNADEDNASVISTYKYDIYGNLIEVIEYNEIGEPKNKKEYIYSK